MTEITEWQWCGERGPHAPHGTCYGTPVESVTPDGLFLHAEVPPSHVPGFSPPLETLYPGAGLDIVSVDVYDHFENAEQPEAPFPWTGPAKNVVGDPEEFRRSMQRIIDAIRAERIGEDQP